MRANQAVKLSPGRVLRDGSVRTRLVLVAAMVALSAFMVAVGLPPLLLIGASGQIAGQYFLAAGDPERWRELARGRSDVWDNAAGANPYFLAPNGDVSKSGKPFDDGVPLRVPAPAALPGEGVYIGVKSTTQDGVDSDDPLAVLNIEGTIATIEGAQFSGGMLTGGRLISERPFLFAAVGDRLQVTDHPTRGIRDDPFVNIAVPALVYCMTALGPNEYLFLHGRAQLDVRDDTA